MLRKFLSLVIISATISSCINSGKKEAASKNINSDRGERVEFAALIANPDNFVGKNIVIEGKVVHVCTETGKKMFIVGENPDVRLFVAAGENISKFPMELLGSEIRVEGVIKRVGGTKPASGEKAGEGMEGMRDSEAGMMKMKGDSCETETALAEQPSLSNIIMEYKSHTVK
jgi:hypothetical protein